MRTRNLASGWSDSVQFVCSYTENASYADTNFMQNFNSLGENSQGHLYGEAPLQFFQSASVNTLSRSGWQLTQNLYGNTV